MGSPLRVSQWHTVHVYMLPPLGHAGDTDRMGSKTQQGGSVPGGPPINNHVQHHYPPFN